MNYTLLFLVSLSMYVPLGAMKEGTSTPSSSIHHLKNPTIKRAVARGLIKHPSSIASSLPELDNPTFPYVYEKTITSIPTPYPHANSTIYPDGKEIALWPIVYAGESNPDAIVQRYDIETQKLETLPCNVPKTAFIQDVSPSPSRDYLAATYTAKQEDDTGTIIVYSAPAGSSFTLGECDGISNQIICDDTSVVATSVKELATIWDINTQKVTNTFGVEGMITHGIVFRPKESLLGALPFDDVTGHNCIRVWDIRLASDKPIFSDPGFSVVTSIIKFNADTSLLGAAGLMGDGSENIVTITDWRKTDKPLKTETFVNNAGVNDFHFHPDGRSYLYNIWWQSLTKASIADEPSVTIKVPTIIRFYLSPDGTRLETTLELTNAVAAFQIWKARTSKAKEGMCLVS